MAAVIRPGDTVLIAVDEESADDVPLLREDLEAWFPGARFHFVRGVTVQAVMSPPPPDPWGKPTFRGRPVEDVPLDLEPPEYDYAPDRD